MDGYGPGRALTPVRRTYPGIFAALADRLLKWVERARSRHMLSKLDDRALQDIGLDRATARHEGQKPFWRG